MWRISLRSVLSHKLRLSLTAIAVVLGVAFASGMLMLTNALDRTFLDIFEGSAQDVLVVAQSAVSDSPTGPQGDPAPLTFGQDVVDRVAALPEVAVAAGGVSTNGAFLIDADGEAVGAAGPPALGVDWTAEPQLRPATIVTGREPTAEFDIVVDEVTFPKLGKQLGDPVTVITPAGEVETVLVGTFKFGETGGLAGATITAFVPATAQRLFAEPGSWQSVSVATADGFTDDQAATAIRGELGEGFSVTTRDEQVQESASALREGLAFLNYILYGFAGISLFVAAFLISNTFSMLVAARGKEMALLRAIGATRRQVLLAVLTEALVVGLAAALVGTGVGYGLALALKAGVGALGLDLTAGVAPTPDALLLAVLLGVTVTVVSAFAPALRASRIRPIEALRQSAAPPDSPGRTVTALGVLSVIGAAALLGPAFFVAEPDLGRTALGALLVLLSGILLAPVLAVAFGRLAAPLLAAVGGIPGRIAGRNASRSPRRVGATASALIVGLALVSGVSVVAASAQRSIEELVDRSFGAELIVTAGAQQPFSPGIGDSIEPIDGVRHVVRLSSGTALIGDAPTGITAIGGGPIESVFTVETTAGDLAAFGPGSAVAASDFAADAGLAVGSEVALTYASGSTGTLTVAAIFEPTALLSGLLVPLADYRAAGGAAQDTFLMVDLEPDADPAVVTPAVEAAAAVNPLLQVTDQTGLKEQNTSALDQLLYIIYAMLGLSVIIAALGVVNTMVLSVVERTREIGLLRAVGAGRRQVRRMIRWEAALVALLGGVVGVGLGVLAAVGLQRALAPSGIDQLVVPPGTVAVLVVAALLIGVLGAAFPARRASRLDVLSAIATE